jgi:GT2 family glycosyltransferase
LILDSPVRLSISCVYFDTDEDVFEKTINSLALSIEHAKKNGLLILTELHLINNNPLKDQWFIKKSINYESRFDKLISHTSHGNIGYGRGNNLAILSTKSDFHLVLNPDVFLAEDNIFNAIHHMQRNPELDALAADAFDSDNNRLYLAKREPSIAVLLARAINSKWLNKLLHKQLERYEYRDSYLGHPKMMSIELMSGCYMFVRTQKLQTLGGFDEKYFLYFEDFDLSRKIQTKALVFSVKIHHLGGKASRKGISHIRMFLISMIRYLRIRRLDVNTTNS